MSVPQVFNFQDQFPVTITLIDGVEWFKAVDVCNVLEMSDPNNAMRMLENDEKTRIKYGGIAYNFVNESGLYNIIFRSNMPKAKAFRKWVTSVLLPEIRKTGEFSSKPKVNLTEKLLASHKTR